MHEGLLSTANSINAADKYLAPPVPMIGARQIAKLDLTPKVPLKVRFSNKSKEVFDFLARKVKF